MSLRQTAAQVVVAGITISALVGTGVYLGRMTASGSGGTAAPRPEPVAPDVVDSLWNVLALSGSRIGRTTAPVILVELADFECPACLRFERDVLRPARATFPEELAVVFHHWPLSYHRSAAAAARAAVCADAQGRFPEMHDVLYDAQDSLGRLPWSALASRAGVSDLDAFQVCVTASQPLLAIEQGTDAAMRLKARGTPTLLLNGRLLEAPPDSAGLVEMIRAALASHRAARPR